MNTCAHPDCDASIPDDAFACTPHWEQLAPEVQVTIATTDLEGRRLIREAIADVW